MIRLLATAARVARPSIAAAGRARALSTWMRDESIVERRPPLTKIIATVGPSCIKQDVLQDLVHNGMRVMRINSSHTPASEIKALVTKLRSCRGVHNASLGANFNMRACMIDLAGPEVRVGLFKNPDGVSLVRGQTVTLHADAAEKDSGTVERFFVDYPIARHVQPGAKILLDDGGISLTVEAVDAATSEVRAVVENSGPLRKRKKVSVPGAAIDLPCMTPEDYESVRAAVEHDVEFIAISFVQDAKDVTVVREYVDACRAELGKDKIPPPMLIAKIESAAALRNIHAIIEAANGIMVARGDLGVEIPMQRVTSAQKEIVHRCNELGKPVIVATQMLESMVSNLRPTRAEISDVTNAVHDGADCVMLSGETATGQFPVQAVAVMSSCINEAESTLPILPPAPPLTPSQPQLWAYPHGRVSLRHLLPASNNLVPRSRDAVLHGLSAAAVLAARELDASVIVVMSLTGRTARFVAAKRPHVPIMAFVPEIHVARQLIMHRGIHPVVATKNFLWHTAQACIHAQTLGFCSPGDLAVVVNVEPNIGDGRVVGGSSNSASLHVVKIT